MTAFAYIPIATQAANERQLLGPVLLYGCQTYGYLRDIAAIDAFHRGSSSFLHPNIKMDR
jgi:hypothetical protein